MYMLVYYNLVLVVKEQLTLKVLPKERITTAQVVMVISYLEPDTFMLSKN